MGAVGCAMRPRDSPTSLSYTAQVEHLESGEIEIAKVNFVAVPATDTHYEVTCEITYKNHTEKSPVLLLFETWSPTSDKPVAGVVLLSHGGSEFRVAKSVPFLTSNKYGPIEGRGAGYRVWLGHAF